MSVLTPAGAPAFAIAEIAWVLIGGATLIFALVMGLIAWTVVRRGGRGNDRPATIGSGVWIVGGGFVFPVLVVVALFAYVELRSAGSVAPPSDDALVVSVTGRMWWWEVRYRDPTSGAEITLANEVHLPVGREVVIGLNSADVIHSFWVPPLAGKVDTVPGHVQRLKLVAERPGRYRGPCAEFCGDQHARMALEVVVHSPSEFDAWLEAQARPAALPSRAPAERGRRVFESERCAACHTIRGLFEGGAAGPDLTHVASRRLLAAGTLATSATGFERWLANVQHLKPGARMPSYERLEGEPLAALAAFLAQLR